MYNVVQTATTHIQQTSLHTQINIDGYIYIDEERAFINLTRIKVSDR